MTSDRLVAGLVLLLWLTLGAACREALFQAQQGPVPVTIIVDNETRHVRTEATTIRQLLAENQIILNDLDRVNPDLNFSVRSGMTIRVVRVSEELETEQIALPYEQRIVVNEALAPGERQLAQLGANGQEEVVTRVIYEDGVEVERVQVSQTILQAPVEEILVVGAEQQGSPIPIEGVIAYLSGGNAWVMRDQNTTRRPLTRSGDLDGRVFELSPDGAQLLFTRVVSDALDTPLNELWLVDTRIVGEEPISLSIASGLLFAAWSPVSDTLIAYSTAERVASQPGWRANNDLWLWEIGSDPLSATEIVPPNQNGFYPWWGNTYRWSPDGRSIAFANAGQIGLIDVVSGTVTLLDTFEPYQTNSDWVWVPTLSWSPDSRFVATVLHGLPQSADNGASADTSDSFDVWLLAADGSFQVRAWPEAGMWSSPVWYQQGIIFGQAINPLRSVDSHYKLVTMDWDGSNAQILFPTGEEPGVLLPEVAWDANEEDRFLFVNRNNLYLYPGDGSPPQPLTSDGQSRLPRWIIPAAGLSRADGTLPVIRTTNRSNQPDGVVSTTRSITP